MESSNIPKEQNSLDLDQDTQTSDRTETGTHPEAPVSLSEKEQTELNRAWDTAGKWIRDNMSGTEAQQTQSPQERVQQFDLI